MPQPKDLDRLDVWLRMAIRRARQTYRDGRREDDSNIPPGHENGGWRIKTAVGRMERTAMLLLDALADKSRECTATKPQAERASRAIQGFLTFMAKDVEFIAYRIAADSPDALKRADELVTALLDDANASLDVVIADARTAITGNGRIRAKPGPDIDAEWRRKVWAYCDKIGKAAVGDPDRSRRLFLSDVKRFYGLPFDAKPKDPRRTDTFRQEWLDAKAGLTR